jgi:hypothetical protein
MAARARRDAACARGARERRPALALRAAEARARLPRARLFDRFRRGLAARLLPVLRNAAGEGDRFLPLRRRRGAGQTSDLARREAVVRGRAQTRRALPRHAARRAALDRAREPAALGRVHLVRARPQALRALHRQGLRLAAHRPARHSAAQREYARGGDRDLPRRRPQSDRHRARLRLPAQSEPLSVRADRRRARRKGVERRTLRRADAQYGSDHRLSDRGRGEGAAARRLRDDRGAEGDAGQRLRPAGDAMVHRLRSRARRLFDA